MPADNEKQPENEKTAKKVEEKTSFTTQKVYGDFLGAYKSFSETSSKVVQQAASILESEIATGIKFANQTENKFPQIERFRTENPSEVIQRFRRDAHEVVDIFVDVVGATMQSMPNLENLAATKEGNVIVKPMQPAESQRPVLKSNRGIKIGEKAEIQMSIENVLTVPTKFSLYTTDLINDDGDRLPSNQVKFTPETLTIAPRMTEQITITVAVPKTAKPGNYSGLVLASHMPQLRSEITVTVE
jgi:hypothetical protein